jgi:hypothetical protein
MNPARMIPLPLCLLLGACVTVVAPPQTPVREAASGARPRPARSLGLASAV